MIPEMEKRWCCQCRPFSARPWLLRPEPSALLFSWYSLVIYAVVVGESISDLFMAGIVPGILGWVWFDYCVRYSAPARNAVLRENDI